MHNCSKIKFHGMRHTETSNSSVEKPYYQVNLPTTQSTLSEIVVPVIVEYPNRYVFVPDGIYNINLGKLPNFTILCVTLEILVLLYFD